MSNKDEILEKAIQSLTISELQQIVKTAVFEMETDDYIITFQYNKNSYIEILNYLIQQTNNNEDGANIALRKE